MHPAVQRTLITVPLEATAGDVARTMNSTGIGSVLVVDPQGKLVGIVTGRDLVIKVIGRGRNLDTMPIHDVMTASPATIRMDACDHLIDFARMMGRAKVRRVPVVDKDGKPVGILTLEDVLARVADIVGALGMAVSTDLTAARLRAHSR